MNGIAASLEPGLTWLSEGRGLREGLPQSWPSKPCKHTAIDPCLLAPASKGREKRSLKTYCVLAPTGQQRVTELPGNTRQIACLKPSMLGPQLGHKSRAHWSYLFDPKLTFDLQWSDEVGWCALKSRNTFCCSTALIRMWNCSNWQCLSSLLWIGKWNLIHWQFGLLNLYNMHFFMRETTSTGITDIWCKDAHGSQIIVSHNL